jgi:RNase P subunit RPR2
MVSIVGKDPGAVKRVTCRNCSSILEYVQSEVQSYIHHDYGGGADTVYHISCPCCAKQLNVRGP